MADKPVGKKVCPLSMAQNGKLALCAREQCGWWDEVTERCAVLLLGQQLHGCATPEGEFLVVIADRTDPFEHQE